MPGKIQELRPDGVEKATAFAAACGCKLSPGRVVPVLSLTASENGECIAVLLCVEHDYRHRLEIGHGAEGDHSRLCKLLIDKALMKLCAAGIRTCDLSTNGAPNDPLFWASVNWFEQATTDAA